MKYLTFTQKIKNEITKLPNEKNEKKNFLRTAFLMSGSVVNPQKEYHLEILTDNRELAEMLADILYEFGISAKIIEKKYKFSTYIKEADAISLFLNIIGAHEALLEFEEIKVLHEMNNQVNRVVNCETANLTKIVDASVRQIEAINVIKEKKGLSFLPEQLREIAVLRLENPDASLDELGKLLSRPIGKSGVNHRLKKIEKTAEEL